MQDSYRSMRFWRPGAGLFLRFCCEWGLPEPLQCRETTHRHSPSACEGQSQAPQQRVIQDFAIARDVQIEGRRCRLELLGRFGKQGKPSAPGWRQAPLEKAIAAPNAPRQVSRHNQQVPIAVLSGSRSTCCSRNGIASAGSGRHWRRLSGRVAASAPCGGRTRGRPHGTALCPQSSPTHSHTRRSK
jgi:hypothetical protein